MEPVAVDARTVRALRSAILRPGQSADAVIWSGDDASDSLHVAVLSDGEPVGVASVMREGYPPQPGPRDWRIRGMATVPSLRGQGIGAALLACCVEHARSAGGRRVWCNARVRAVGLYERAGLEVVGGEFEIAGIGPHLLMCIRLAAG